MSGKLIGVVVGAIVLAFVLQILVVVAVVVFAGPAILRTVRMAATEKHRGAAADIQLLEGVLDRYAADLGGYPTTRHGLAALWQAPADLGDTSSWQGPYLQDVTTSDPWGQPYQYRFPGRKAIYGPDIWSCGPDGEDGTEDDIGNWTDLTVVHDAWL